MNGFRFRWTWMVVGVASAWVPTWAGETGAVEEPLAPFVMPAPVLGPADRTIENGARLTAVRAQIEADLQAAKASEDPVARAEALLQAANRTVSFLVEPFVSDWFLRIERENAQAEQSEARAAMDQAQALIAEANTALEKSPADSTSELRRRAARLDALTAAIRLATGLSTSTDQAKDIRQAISRISPLLESSEPAVAGAAAFWRACVLSMETDPKAALEGMELAVAEISKDAIRYGFYKRLLRCRLMAANKGEAAALALLNQIEERIDEWFGVEADRLDAIRTVGLVKLQTISAWRQRLDEKAEADERAWCLKEMNRIRGERFGGGEGEPVVRLGEAVPLLHLPPPAAPDEKKPEKLPLPPPE